MEVALKTGLNFQPPHLLPLSISSLIPQQALDQLSIAGVNFDYYETGQNIFGGYSVVLSSEASDGSLASVPTVRTEIEMHSDRNNLPRIIVHRDYDSSVDESDIKSIYYEMLKRKNLPNVINIQGHHIQTQYNFGSNWRGALKMKGKSLSVMTSIEGDSWQPILVEHPVSDIAFYNDQQAWVQEQVGSIFQLIYPRLIDFPKGYI